MPTAPSAPIIGAASAGDAQATVSFSSPVSNGGSAITSYTVTSSPGNKTATGSSSPLVVTGLTNGTAYSFIVTAKNGVGTSPTSAASNAVTPLATPVTVATVPNAPIIGTATAGNGNASITFASPANNGGSAITSYTVTSSPGNFIATGTSSPLLVSGLSNGTSYTFTVKATNAIGNSVASAASNAVTPTVPPTAPGAPTSVVASLGAAGTGTASVAFSAPTSTGGSSITNYTVTSNPGNIVVTTASSPASFTGLAMGTPYTFTVKANNGVGAGTPSAASNSVTPLAAVPSAPASASAAAGNAQAMVSFSPSASNGGSVITSYTATSTPGGFTASGLSSPLTVTGLVNGTTYTFAVKANNAAGSSASITTNTVTPAAPAGGATVSGAPTAVSALVGNTQATVSFSAPANNGGSAITLYTVTSSGGQTGSGATSPIVVAGLTNGVAYTFTVTATNGVGSSVASAASAAVTPFAPLTIPGAPTIGSAVGGNSQATVSFTPPVNTGGGIASYTVTSTPGNQTATGAASPLMVSGLVNGTPYTFVVTATNAAGTSVASTASNAVTPTSAVTIASMPFNGNTGMGVATNYTYTTTGTINQINVMGAANASLMVFTNASFSVSDANWNCMSSCIATTPVPAGTPLYIQVWNNNGGAFNLNVANIVITPSQGVAGTPLAISMPFTTGMVGSAANSYYAYTTTVSPINKISSTEPTAATWATATTWLDVYTDATFSVVDPNWRCPAANACFYRGAAPLPVGTVLYIQEFNSTNGVGANYTLSASNVLTVASEGLANAPLVITMPHAGRVGTFKNSHYSYTTTFASTTAITMDAMTEDVDSEVFTDATFTLRDINWTCTANFGTTPDDCTATTPVPAGTVLYIRAKNFANGVGATFNVSVTGTGVPPPPAATSFSILGTVAYAGAKSGSVTVKVANAGNPGFIQWMKNIPAAGAYTVQGLTPGNYVVTAEMDALNNGAANASNPRTATPVATSIAAVNAAVNLTLTDPVAPAPVTPMIQWVSAGNTSVMVGTNNPTNASNQEIATSYKVYWGTDAATATVGGGTKVVTAPGAQAGGPIYVGSLTNGTAYYFKVSALVGVGVGAVESAPSAVMGPKTVNAPTGLNTVTGTVSTPGATIPAGAAMIVGLFSNTTGVYYTQITNPTVAQTFSIAGVPAGTYNHFAIIDMNGNGVIETGDLSNTNGNAPLVPVAGATTSNLTLPSANATLRVATQYDAQWNNYGLRVEVADGVKRVVGVKMLSGPKVLVPSDLAATANNSGWSNLSAIPVLGDSYGFTVFYSDGTSQAMTANVMGVLSAGNVPTGLVTSTVAVGASVGAPLFSWAAPATLPAGNYSYSLGLQGASANWWMWGMPSTQLSVLYNANGNASAATLTPGSNAWHVEIIDAFGNTALSPSVTY